MSGQVWSCFKYYKRAEGERCGLTTSFANRAILIQEEGDGIEGLQMDISARRSQLSFAYCVGHLDEDCGGDGRRRRYP